jgi:hypothetical protein
MRPTRMSVIAISAFAALFAWPLRAQAPVTIDSGMDKDAVIKRLGPPLSIRTYGSHTYLSYANGCEKNCGMTDIVTLDSGKVVDAIFRSPERRYAGKSSSPQMIPASLASSGTPIDSTGPRHVKVPAGYVAPVAVKRVPPEKKAEPEKREEKREEAKPVAPQTKSMPPQKAPPPVSVKAPPRTAPPPVSVKAPPTKSAPPPASKSPAPTKPPVSAPATKAGAPPAKRPAVRPDTAKKPAATKKPD